MIFKSPNIIKNVSSYSNEIDKNKNTKTVWPYENSRFSSIISDIKHEKSLSQKRILD